MEPDRSLAITPQLVLGLLVVLAGVIFTLDNMGWLYAWDYLRYWPSGLIVLGVARYAYSQHPPGRLVGAMLVVAGALLLANEVFLWGLDLFDFWPLVLVFAGGMLVWQAMRHTAAGPPEGADPGNWVNAVAVLGGVERASNSQDFQGGELTAFMGGCEIDLTRASMRGSKAVVNVFAMWGGIQLRIPEDWTVDLEGLPIMGGFVDKTRPVREAKDNRLVIRGLVLMGGMEVRN